ncbi:hypothetical protein SAMN05660976_08469 [Nonomuraea pusilla]|uniref:C2H2-type domain-containing protein n=1 Tax=Nonomuraea pusilla TaxID=46177 RepID=A0A1H8JXU2_9ACTN|nr:hypothetical protein SAMN05660976_08469 [Nonomuraea pusilla]
MCADSYTCTRCGCLVDERWREEHNVFHRQIDELLAKAPETPDSP